MVDEHRPGGGSPGADDYRYFGPFGSPGRELPGDDDWGSEPTQQLPESSAEGGSPATVRFPAPAGVPPLQPRPFRVDPRQPVRRPGGIAGAVAAAAVTAVIVGSAAGFGGALLAGRVPAGQTTPPPAPTSSPSPSVNRSPMSPAPDDIDTVAVAQRVLPSTVTIRVGSGSAGSTGSGFVLDGDGRIMTNNHVVAGGGRIRVIFSDGSRAQASVVGRSPSYDIAVLKVPAGNVLQPLPIGDSDAAEVGQTVVAVGSPLGLSGTVTQGIISAKDRPVAVRADDEADAPSAYINGIQTDAPINPGNSGGPLVDAAARVIGVNSAILTLGESRTQAGNIGLGFAIPINQAMEVADQLIKNGKATYPVIGANVSSSAEADGVTLTEVERGGPAARAGLRAGDVVVAIDGQPVYEIEDLIVAIRSNRPGDRVTLRYERGGVPRTAQVTLGSKEG